MAATIQEQKTIDAFRKVAVQGDSSYPTNGYLLSGMIGPEQVVVVAGVSNGMGAEYDRAANKLRFYVAATGAEVANATDLSAVTAFILVA